MNDELIGWIGNFILIVATYKIGDKKRYAFLLTFLGELVWLIASLMKGSPSMSFLCIIFGGLALINYWKWSYNEIL